MVLLDQSEVDHPGGLVDHQGGQVDHPGHQEDRCSFPSFCLGEVHCY